MLDEIVRLHDQGLSAREIAERVGRTRNSVIGTLYRYKQGRFPRPAKVLPPHEVMAAAIEANRGNLRAAARSLGIAYHDLYGAGFKGRASNSGKNFNTARDPDTYALVESIDASGMLDRDICEQVDMGMGNIYAWRKGLYSASPFLAQCVRTVLTEKQNDRH